MLRKSGLKLGRLGKQFMQSSTLVNRVNQCLTSKLLFHSDLRVFNFKLQGMGLIIHVHNHMKSLCYSRIVLKCCWISQTLAARRLTELQEALNNQLDVIKKIQHMQVCLAISLTQTMVRSRVFDDSG